MSQERSTTFESASGPLIKCSQQMKPIPVTDRFIRGHRLWICPVPSSCCICAWCTLYNDTPYIGVPGRGTWRADHIKSDEPIGARLKVIRRDQVVPK